LNTPKDERREIPSWHRAVYVLAAVPLLLFTLMGWEHGAYLIYGIPTLICLGLAVWPLRVGAAILFWPIAAGACLYGALLVQDGVVISQGGTPSVLLDADDSIAFLVLELTLIVVAVLFLAMWRPIALRKSRG
jgi:hypothetical protein